MIKNYRYFLERKTKQIILPFCLGIMLSVLGNSLFFEGLSPAFGQNQTIRPTVAAEQIYQRLSFLPLENEYSDRTSGDIVTNNTLMLRFIRYHEYVKSRPLGYRFDWQLTFADYFDINEPIKANRYPGYKTLAVNPLEKDREFITQLTRDQRNQLIDTLLAIYSPQDETFEQPVDSSNDSIEKRNTEPSLPQPGDADLLLLN